MKLRQRSKSNTSLFLLEMIIVCAFMLYCSSLFVKAFIKAEQLSILTEDRNNAILLCESIGEDWKAGKVKIAGEGSVIYYCLDKNWSIIEESDEQSKYVNLNWVNYIGDNYCYICRLSYNDLEESMYVKELNLTVFKNIYTKTVVNTEELYSLTLTKFEVDNEKE